MGGEDETIDFESLKLTVVFWNKDDYPIPVDNTDALGPIFGDILKALHIMGFRYGFMDVILYSEQHNYDQKEADIVYPSLPRCDNRNTGSVFNVPDITLHMIRHASNIGPGPINFLVIAKPKWELDRVVQCLKSRRHNVLLVEPPPSDEEFLFTVDSLLENTRLLGGGKPRYNPLHCPCDTYFENSSVEIQEDVSKMVDFSEHIPTVKGERTAIFWDAVVCPFPPSFTPDQIYHSISSFLIEREFSDKITIWAYLDDDDYKKRDVLLSGDKTWASSIYFLPVPAASRRIRMLNDIKLWEWDSPRLNTTNEAALILVSDQFKDEDVYYRDMLQRMRNWGYFVVLVTPTLDINKPESPEWPGLLIDEGAYVFDEVVTQHASHDVAEEEVTPEEEEFPMDYDPFDDQSSDSPETEEGRQRWRPWTTEEVSKLIPPQEPLVYRWDPQLLLYKLAVLFPEPADEETPLYHWDPHAQMMKKLESLAPFPKDHEAAEDETPQKLATHGICRFEAEDIKKPESPELPAGLLLDKPFSDSSEDAEAEEMLDSLLWKPRTKDIKKPESAEWPAGLLIDGGTGCESSEELCPKKHKANAAEKGTPKRLPLSPLEPNTLLRPKNKLKSPEWPGWQIHGGRVRESSEERCPKKHKANAAEKGTPKRLPLSPLEPNTCYGRKTN